MAQPSGNPLAVFEHAFYIGNYISGILYGVALVMYFATMKSLYQKGSRNSPNARRFFAIYSTILILLLTIDTSVNAVWGEIMWINGRDGPGGVTGFITTQVSVWYQTLGSTSVVALIFLGDALLLQRLYIIYGSRLWVVAFPILAYLVAFSLAVIELVLSGKPGGNFFGGKTINFGTPYYAITISLNILVTLLISYRLRQLSSPVSDVLGRENTRVYTSVVSMLVESAAPYSLFGIMFLIPYARGSQTAVSFGQVWAKLTCLSPQLIIFRVVNGKAWGREVVAQAESTVVFGHKSQGAIQVAPGAELGSHDYSSRGITLEAIASEKWDGERSIKSLATDV